MIAANMLLEAFHVMDHWGQISWGFESSSSMALVNLVESGLVNEPHVSMISPLLPMSILLKFYVGAKPL